MKIIRSAQRSIEGPVGAYLIRKNQDAEVRKSGLVRKEYTNAKGHTMAYLEKGNASCPSTLLISYGITQCMEENAALVNLLNLPKDYRIVIPEAMGHGDDKRRVHATQDYPSPSDIIDGYSEIIHYLDLKDIDLLGYSMGGGIAYHLQVRHSELIRKAVLVSPALEAVVTDEFRETFESGEKAHHTFEDREQLKIFFRDLAPANCKKRNPVPKFLLQGVVQSRLHNTPKDYYRKWLTYLNSLRGEIPEMAAEEDELPSFSNRKVYWFQDDFICDHDKGMAFFSKSSCTQVSLPNAGHLFNQNGDPTIFGLLPQIKEYLVSDGEKQEQAP